MPERASFRYFKTSPEIIWLTVMLCSRFPQSLRNVEDLLHDAASRSATRQCDWWNRCGPVCAVESKGKRVEAMCARIGDERYVFPEALIMGG